MGLSVYRMEMEQAQLYPLCTEWRVCKGQVIRPRRELILKIVSRPSQAIYLAGYGLQLLEKD